MSSYSSAFAIYDGTTSQIQSNIKIATPIQIMSCTKSFASLAIGILYDMGAVRLSDRLSKWIPNIQDSRITIKHVLTHTSGISAEWNSGRKHDSAPNVYDYILDLKMTHIPGTKFIYNNNAVELVGLLVSVLIGTNLRDFLYKHLFKPLGIRKPNWYGDKSGNSYVAWGLCLNYVDMIKVGRLLLDEGRNIISAKYVHKMESLSLLVWKHPLGYYFEGYMGNLLLIIPKHRRIIVRLVKTPSRYSNDIQYAQLKKILRQPLSAS